MTSKPPVISLLGFTATLPSVAIFTPQVIPFKLHPEPYSPSWGLNPSGSVKIGVHD